MVQVINDPYGKGKLGSSIGSAFGQGLAEQIPKEVERGRLAKGLQQFEQQSGNLTPLQQLARLSSIPGVTPQMIQSFGELARQQSTRNAYRSQQEIIPENAGSPKQNFSQQAGQIPFANIQKNGIRPRSQEDIVRPEEMGQSQAERGSPLREEVTPRMPWSPEQRDTERVKIIDQFPWMNDQQIEERLTDKEKRYLTQPEAAQAIDAYNDDQANKIKDALTKRLELLTQKKGDDLFKDITGEMQNNFYRTVLKDIRENPNLTAEDAVNKRANQLLRVVKAKGDLNSLANRDFLDKINPIKKKETLKKLQDAASTFNNIGDNEELFNILRTTSDKGGFGLSPSNAAWIAYPQNKDFKNFSNTIKNKLGSDRLKTSKYYASQVSKLIKPEDSILSMYAELKRKDPYFDPNVFFDELRTIKNDSGFTDAQKNEFIKGEPDYFPNWGDVFLFPLTEGGWL